MNIRDGINWLLGRKAVEAAGADLKRKMAEYLAQRARMYCPVDTGVLVRSIDLIAPRASGAFHVVATADYSVFVEFGYMHVGGTWIPPNPFMRNAMADAKAAFPTIAQTVRLRRPDGPGNEWEPATFSDVQHLGVTL